MHDLTVQLEPFVDAVQAMPSFNRRTLGAAFTARAAEAVLPMGNVWAALGDYFAYVEVGIEHRLVNDVTNYATVPDEVVRKASALTARKVVAALDELDQATRTLLMSEAVLQSDSVVEGAFWLALASLAAADRRVQ